MLASSLCTDCKRAWPKYWIFFTILNTTSDFLLNKPKYIHAFNIPLDLDTSFIESTNVNISKYKKILFKVKAMLWRLPCTSNVAFSIRRSKCSSRAGRDQGGCTCPALVSQNRVHENLLWFLAVEFFPTQIAKRANVLGWKIPPSLPKTTELVVHYYLHLRWTAENDTLIGTCAIDLPLYVATDFNNDNGISGEPQTMVSSS